jgi:hypothetical protein
MEDLRQTSTSPSPSRSSWSEASATSLRRCLLAGGRQYVSVSLHPPHRCARQRGPCIDAVFDGIMLAARGGKSVRKVRQLGILFGTAQVRHPSAGKGFVANSTRLTPLLAAWAASGAVRKPLGSGFVCFGMVLGSPSTLISVTVSGSETTLYPVLSVVRRAQRIFKAGTSLRVRLRTGTAGSGGNVFLLFLQRTGFFFTGEA